ncbi:Zonadhesin [Dirofilaria immitis]|nr:hypothetical protein [Dirofilaria immitis]
MIACARRDVRRFLFAILLLALVENATNTSVASVEDFGTTANMTEADSDTTVITTVETTTTIVTEAEVTETAEETMAIETSSHPIEVTAESDGTMIKATVAIIMTGFFAVLFNCNNIVNTIAIDGVI